MQRWIGLTLVLTACGGSKTVDPRLTEAPEAMLTSHSEGDEVGEGNTVTFSGWVSDADNEIDELTTTWWAGEELACDEAVPAEDGFTSCAIEIPSGSTLDVRLDVVDARTLGASDKVTVTIIPSAPPAVTILEPDNNAVFYEGEPISFSTLVSDEDTDLSEIATWWMVNEERVDGDWPVASSGTVAGALDPLIAGGYTLVFWAEDPQGNSDYETVEITVLPADSEPSCEITEPEADATVRLGADLTLAAIVSDPEQDPETLSVVWTSSMDTAWSLAVTPGSDGNASATTNELSRGSHNLTLTVTDDGGGTCVDSVSINVGETPSVQIDAPAEDSLFHPDDLIIFEGTVSDNETDPADLIVEWIADADGTALCEDETATSSGATRCNVNASELALGTQTVTLRATDEDGLYEEDYVRFTISDNTAPTLTSVEIIPSPAYVDSTLTCSWAAADVDGDVVTAAISWTIDGTEVGTAATLAGAFAAEDVVICTVTPNDGTVDGDPASTSVTIANSVPRVSDVSITPDPAYAGDGLTCNWTGFYTPDGGTDASTLVWTDDGTEIGTTATVSGDYVRGDTVSCTVTPTDSDGESGTPVTASIVISNPPPTLVDLAISPPSPSVSATLSFSGTLDDVDGDTVSTSATWALEDGTTLGTGSTLTLAGLGLEIGTWIHLTVTPTDGYDDGTSVETWIELQNGRPEVSSLTLTPDPLYTSDVAMAEAEVEDPEGDAVTLAYTWFVNSALVSGETGTTLDGTTHFERGDEVYAVVTPSDADGAGDPVASDTLTVQNSPPSAPVVTISPEDPSCGVDLVCNIDTESEDADGDPITYTISWTVDGDPFEVDEDAGETADTVLGVYTTCGETWTCTITPNDSLEDGPSGSASVSADARDPSWDPSSDLSAADYGFTGEAGTNLSGSAVSGAGDVDGDGLDDILIGAYYADAGGGGNAGRSYIVLGESLTSGTVGLSSADYVFLGEEGGDLSGHAVSNAGDVDGDGLADVLIGAYQNDDGGLNAGKAYLILGKSIADTRVIDLISANYSFVGEGASNHAGCAVASAGDVDGDGLDDILIGARDAYGSGGESGKAYLFLAASLGDTETLNLADADYVFLGEHYDDSAGHKVSGAGDLDDDGLDDFLISAPNNDDGGTNAGITYVILGASLGEATAINLEDADYKLVGESNGDQSGTAIAGAGDVDGDGLADILVGAEENDDYLTNAGKVYLVFGSRLAASPIINLVDADFAFVGEAGSNKAGDAVSSAGDVDGDGLSDLLIGAPLHSGVHSSGGKAYVILGASLLATPISVLSSADYAFIGEENGDQAGTSVSSAGDVNGDGYDDILIGAHENDEGAGRAGKTYLLLP